MKNFCLIPTITILSFFVSHVAYCQSSKTFSSGIIYRGAFDIEKEKVIDEMEIYAYITQLKMVDYDYFIYAKDKKGENFSIKFSKINDDSNINNIYIDAYGNEYIIIAKGNNLNILSLAPPIPGIENIHMLLQIIVDY